MLNDIIKQLEKRVASLEEESSRKDTQEYEIRSYYALTPKIKGDSFASKHLLEVDAEIVDNMIAEYLGSEGKVKDFQVLYYRMPQFGGSYIVEAKPNTFEEDFEKTFKLKGEKVYVYFEAHENTKEIEIVAQIKRPRKVDVNTWEYFLESSSFYDEVEALLKKNKVTNLKLEESDWDLTKNTIVYNGTVKWDLISKLPKRMKLPSGYTVTFRYAKEK